MSNYPEFGEELTHQEERAQAIYSKSKELNITEGRSHG